MLGGSFSRVCPESSAESSRSQDRTRALGTLDLPAVAWRTAGPERRTALQITAEHTDRSLSSLLLTTRGGIPVKGQSAPFDAHAIS